MRAAQSDLILNLLNDAAKVETAIATHADEVVQRLDAWAAPLPDFGETGAPQPDFRSVLLSLKAGLSASREKLNRAEQAHIERVRQAMELRETRQELTDSLYGDFSSMRRLVEELYRGKGEKHPSAFVVAGIQGPTRQRPKGLLRQVDLALAHLSQPGLVFPAPRFGNIGLTPQDLVEILQPQAQRLREVLAELRRLGSELDASRKEKQRAIKLHRSQLSAVSKSAAALFQLAGESELAKRLRPKRRARRRGEVAETAASTEVRESAEVTESTQDATAPDDTATAESIDESPPTESRRSTAAPSEWTADDSSARSEPGTAKKTAVRMATPSPPSTFQVKRFPQSTHRRDLRNPFHRSKEKHFQSDNPAQPPETRGLSGSNH